jgi:hypothetical protein
MLGSPRHYNKWVVIKLSHRADSGSASTSTMINLLISLVPLATNRPPCNSITETQMRFWRVLPIQLPLPLHELLMLLLHEQR